MCEHFLKNPSEGAWHGLKCFKAKIDTTFVSKKTEKGTLPYFLLTMSVPLFYWVSLVYLSIRLDRVSWKMYQKYLNCAGGDIFFMSGWSVGILSTIQKSRAMKKTFLKIYYSQPKKDTPICFCMIWNRVTLSHDYIP